jgi:DNA-binding response OmpR family regulator
VDEPTFTTTGLLGTWEGYPACCESSLTGSCNDSPVKILVVEDEPLIASFIEKGLRAEGHQVEIEGAGDRVLDHLVSLLPDLVLLDVMLPGLDGFEVLGAIRAIDPRLPVIMLTARGEIEDRVRGLDLGATDYLVKPFAFAELAARVRAHLRTTGADAPTRSDTLELGRVHLDLLAREALVDGAPVTLSTREFSLLGYLMRHPRQVLSRQQLLDAVWGYAFDPRSNVVDVYVGYLRSKLDRPDEASVIDTVRGMGYRFVG